MTISQRHLAVLVLCMVLAWTSGRNVLADQTDPMLDVLFEQLHDQAVDPQMAHGIIGEIWQRWLSSEDEQVNRLMSRGIDALNEHALQDAVAIFGEVIEIAPEFAEGWNKRATVYYMLQEYDLSTADVRETLRLEPRHFGALSGQGLIYLQTDRKRAALEYFSRALQVNPFMEAVRINVDLLQQELAKEII